MRNTRVFVDFPLRDGDTVTLDGEAAHHLGRVLKVRPGERVTAFDGNGGCYDCNVVGVDRRSVTIKTLAFRPGNNESLLELTLAQGISRGQHMDYTVQKAVELGVTRIVPLFTEFSNVRLEEERAQKRIDHWRKIVIGACEQSGRNLLPQLSAPMNLSDWIDNDTSAIKLVLHPDAEQGLASLPADAISITLLCGPEGGLSTAEIDYALARGYRMVALGPRVLRTETAALAAISVCQALCGDMMYNRASQK